MQMKIKEHRTVSTVLTLIIFLSVCGGMLIIGEVVIRNIFADVTTTADNSSFFARKWKEQQRINHLGFREREFSIPKKRGNFRIAVIGDSLTYGQGVDEDERFSNLLESKLRKFYDGVEVLNFGRPGAETGDHVVILKDVVTKIAPDFILLQWFINDVEGMGGMARQRPMRLIPSDRLSSWLHQNSALFFLLNQQWVALQGSLGLVENYPDYMVRKFGNPTNHESQRAVEDLKEFIVECRQQNIEIGIVLFPALSRSSSEGYPFDFLHERVLEQCESANIPCLDLRDAFGKVDHNDVRQLWANRLDPHPGQLAHRMASQEILKVFGKIWQERIGQQFSQYIKRDKNVQRRER